MTARDHTAAHKARSQPGHSVAWEIHGETHSRMGTIANKV
jgi:hypothetical protein